MNLDELLASTQVARHFVKLNDVKEYQCATLTKREMPHSRKWSIYIDDVLC